MRYIFFLPAFLIACILSCGDKGRNNLQDPNQEYPKGSFGHDLDFLNKKDQIILLQDGDAEIAISAKYQARVFTSTARGKMGRSFGWVNEKAFAGPLDPHMNAYGGENRIWLGPEGGNFSLFFPKDSAMIFSNWKTPAAFDSEPWELAGRSDSSVDLQKNMLLLNYVGTHLNLRVNRRISLIKNVFDFLHLPATDSAHAVGYQTENELVNTGQAEWNEHTGMPCIWILDMFNPSDQSTILIPFLGNAKPATTDYFGEIPANRIKYKNNLLFFKADGRMRGKLGIHPAAATTMEASYDSLHQVLTLIRFDIENTSPYLNQEWKTSKPPFSGDAVNAYNDGPLESGGQLGPFYELESVSPAAFLKPAHSITHRHAVFHFTGSIHDLDRIAESLLGLSIEDINSVFKN
jgi:hypothetical protein